METMNIKALKAAMILRGVGVKALAEISGLQAYLISQWLKQKQVRVRLPTISKLSKALHISAFDLIMEE